MKFFSFYFFQPLKNLKTIPNLQAIQKEVAG